MITSLLDNDLYKFTMQQAVHALYPRAEVRYRFSNRGKRTKFPSGFAKRLRNNVNDLSLLSLTASEAQYLSNACPFLTPVYLDFLKSYRFDPYECFIETVGGELNLSVQGPWYRTILWEVPLMAMISELYFSSNGSGEDSDLFSREKRRKINTTKAEIFLKNDVRFADFGTRRRFSKQNQNEVLEDILAVKGHTCVGTSNVNLAYKHDIRPIGTHAHEWFMFHAAVNGYRSANKTSLDAWTQVYHGDLGIALTDTYTTTMFLDAFDSVHARLFDGVRHDSGDPFAFANLIIDHYEKLRIDPLSKTIVFSDSVTTEKAVELKKHCLGKIKVSFGIGTHLSNDVGVTPLNMVIKMSHCCERKNEKWYPVVKLSDDEGKHSGEIDEVHICESVVKRKRRMMKRNLLSR